MRLMRRLALFIGTALFVAATAAPARAQYPGASPGDMGGPGGMGGRGMGGMGHHGGMGRGMGERRGGGMADLPTDAELTGPPAPGLLVGLLDLTKPQADRYAPLYADYVAATSLRRDSVRTALAAVRRAVEDHDRDALHRYGPVVHDLAPALRKEDDKFADKTIKPLLTKPQRKLFDEWRDRQKQAADAERAEFRREHQGDRPQGEGGEREGGQPESD